ncbi:MAG TPA: alpha-amylase family glycosyl hydrolase, partial [Solirubrobacteraceae bacterium]|nr:alpha-amylase family glycosyl hydrolase [Solirubrobacteraceae bacterium]
MQNRFAMRLEVRAEFERAAADLGGDGAFQVRLERYFTELRDPLLALYGHDPRFEAQWQRLLRAIAATAGARTPELRLLDHEREITPDWLQREQTLGYVTYVDRFNHTLEGLNERLPYLKELGITYLHLMPLLKARPEPNDGGYAVTDYGAVEPKLGTMVELEELATELRKAGIALCLDVVVNHTASEHQWARQALAGDQDMLARYRTFADREEPDAYERTLPEVFPDTAPGNFTWVPELNRWVWTTFNAYQWDLDYTNPDVFVAMTEAMLGLAAVGVDVLRLDAAPFLGKRMGTDCQNQPEAHAILQVLRAVTRLAM